MSKKPVTLSKGSKSYDDDPEDTSEDEFTEIEEGNPSRAGATANADNPDNKPLTEEEKQAKEIEQRTADKLKADEEAHKQVRDQLDKDNESRKKDAEEQTAKQEKEARAQQAAQNAEFQRASRGS